MDPHGDLPAFDVEPDEYPSLAVFREDVDHGGDEEEEGNLVPDCSAHGPGPAGIGPDHDHMGLAGSARDNDEAGQTLHRWVDAVGETLGATPAVEASSGCTTLAALEELTVPAHEANLTCDYPCVRLGEASHILESRRHPGVCLFVFAYLCRFL